MDHLKSSEERRNRWYAKNIEPHFIPVVDIGIENSEVVIKEEKDEYTTENDDALGVGVRKKVHGIPYKDIGLPKVQEYLKSHLQNEGFVVITKALSLEDCNHGLKLVWDYLEAASAAENHLRGNRSNARRKENNINMPIQRCDPSTYATDANFPRTVEGGILPFYGSGMSSFMWFIRSHPSVQKVFGLIHNTPVDELASSLDGIIAWLHPPSDKGWFHIDQNPIIKPNFESVQGLVNLLPVSRKTGGNVLVEKSQLLYPHHYIEGVNKHAGLFYEERLKEINGDDWLEVDPHDRELLDPSKIISCLLGPGDILIWDSRLVHCSHPPKENENLQSIEGTDEYSELDERKGLLRTAGLVNMIPKSKVSSEVRNRRINSVNICRTLTHWVDKASPLGEERTEEAKKEKDCIDFMRHLQENNNEVEERVLLAYDELTLQQQKLV